MGCEYIGTLASGIWDDLNSPTNISIAFISGKLLSSGFIGEANTITAECNYIESGCLYPPLSAAQQAIYNKLYLYQFYSKEGLRLMSLAASKNFMTSVREGDSSISFASPQQILQTYRGLAREAKADLDSLADYYKRNLAAPQSVNFYTIDQNGINGQANRSYQ